MSPDDWYEKSSVFSCTQHSSLSIAECPDLTDPANGVVVMTGNSVGDTATFTCNSGFELVGAATVTCQDDRQWTDLPSACQIVIGMRTSSLGLRLVIIRPHKVLKVSF